MESQKEAILMTLIGTAKTHNKAYCWISQNRQLELLSKYHSWNISRRTLNRRLAELVNEGYIVRIHRTIKTKDGQKRFNSTLYKFTRKVFQWLTRLGHFARKLLSFPRVPRMAHYSSYTPDEISKRTPYAVEILFKTHEKGGASPIGGFI